MEMPKQNDTMYDSILLNDQIDTIYTNVVNDLKEQNITDEQTVNALLASTSMGFNDLFNTLSRMVINSYIVDKYKVDNEVVVDDELNDVITNTINVITTISKSINNDAIKALTTKLNVLMAKNEVVNENTTDSENNENESENIS